MFENIKNLEFANKIGDALHTGNLETLYNALHPLERQQIDEDEFHLLIRPVLDTLTGRKWHDIAIELPSQDSPSFILSAELEVDGQRQMLYVPLAAEKGTRYVPLRSLLAPVKDWAGDEVTAAGLVFNEITRKKEVVEKLKQVGITDLMIAPGEFTNVDMELANSIAEFGETREEVEAWFEKQGAMTLVEDDKYWE